MAALCRGFQDGTRAPRDPGPDRHCMSPANRSSGSVGPGLSVVRARHRDGAASRSRLMRRAATVGRIWELILLACARNSTRRRAARSLRDEDAERIRTTAPRNWRPDWSDGHLTPTIVRQDHICLHHLGCRRRAPTYVQHRAGRGELLSDERIFRAASRAHRRSDDLAGNETNRLQSSPTPR
jgi:hypothetical protein